MTFLIKNVREVEPERRRLPRVIETLGQPDGGDFRVFLARQAEEKILLAAPPETPPAELSSLAHSFLGENECGGILVGNVYTATEAGRTVTFTAIVDAIAAQEAAAGPTYVEMGADDLMAVTRHLERLRQKTAQTGKETQLRVVGWYHTHPGFGVFMSGTDQATQRNVFGMAWQIAVVYDPLNREYGLFSGPSSTPTRGWYIFDSVLEGFPPPLPLANPLEATRRRGAVRAAAIPELPMLRAQLKAEWNQMLYELYDIISGDDPWRE
jgi:proteasome lid subunit RPN8/RPN11